MTATCKVNEAIRAVLADIHRLKKDDKNQHGGYSYVSVDDVKDHVRPLLAKNSLHFSITEVSYDLIGVAGKTGTTSSAKIAYEIRLRHVSGEEMPPEFITIVLPYTGAQTAGAARSYAVKEWMKSTLLVSTGEKDFITGGADADAYAQQDYTAPVEKSAYRAKKEDGEAFKAIQTGLHTIEKEGTLDDLVLFWKNSQPALKKMNADYLGTLTEQKDELKAKFEEGHNKPLIEPEVDAETGELVS
jgi:hypothetical protein